MANLVPEADASRHQGDFAEIVNGINATLDAVVAPVKEASDTLQDLAKGNLNTGMVGNYNGDYTRIKNDMNQTVAFLKNYVDEIADSLLKMGQEIWISKSPQNISAISRRSKPVSTALLPPQRNDGRNQ